MYLINATGLQERLQLTKFCNDTFNESMDIQIAKYSKCALRPQFGFDWGNIPRMGDTESLDVCG